MQKQDLKISKGQEKQSGITLVALVITVVVMLILAGVAIAAVVDGEGLFSKTREAAETYENVADREGDILENLMGQIDHYLDENKDAGKEPVENQPIVNPINQIVAVNQTYSGETKGSYSDPIIPKGFAPINENGATWGSIDGYQKGLVITDEITGTESTGNEFVWIPVDGTTVKFERYDFEKQTSGTIYSDYSDPEISENEELANISTSVTINGGFYIARFEAGKIDMEELVTDGTVKPVSKQGANVWNNMAWSDNGINDDISPENGAVTVARSMYQVADSNYGAASTLIYGTQWDTALNFIGAYDVGEVNYDTYATDSTEMGNYNGTEEGDPIDAEPASSGASETFRQKNIYDMAGNVWEWTMEKYSTICVTRGGSYNDFGFDYPASFRIDYRLADDFIDDGFRVALYIK